MASEQDQQVRVSEDGWSSPVPDRLPPPTYAPVFVALGVTFLLFGVVSSYIFSAAGAILIVVSAAKWVEELMHGE